MAAMGKTFENEEPTRRGAFISWRWLAIASFLIIALPVGILIANKLRGSDVDRGTRALIEAFSKRRLIEPRLSGGFKGGEFRPSHEDLSGIKTEEFDRARDLITDAGAKGDSSAQLPYARLLLSKGEKLPEALKYLRRAVASSPESAEAHNDLGVCLIQQGKLEDAIDAFEAALKNKADMSEALFNRALCYQRLLLRDAASGELGRLLEIERDGSWLGEIKQRQHEVSAPLAPVKREKEIIAAFDAAMASRDIDEAKRIADQNFEVTIKHAYRECAVEYLKEAVEGRLEQAERVLFEIEFIGRQFAESRGDTSIADLAGYLRNLPDNERQTELRLVSDYLEAENLFSSHKYSDAQRTFERLAKKFAARGNYAFQRDSTHYRASCLYASGHLASSIGILKQDLAHLEQHDWPYSRAIELTQIAIAYSRLGQNSLAIRYCQQALQSGHNLPMLQAYALQFMSDTYVNLGDLDSGLASLRESTNLYLASVPTLNAIANNYLNIADIYRVLGNNSLAPLYARQALSFSDQANDNNRAAQASSFLAVELARLNQFEQAEEQLNRAFKYLESISKGQRIHSESVVLTRAGEMAAQGVDAARAVEYYSKAETVLEKAEDKAIPLMKVLRGRAEAHLQAKEYEKARLDLERAIALIEDYRANIDESKNRSSFLDASHSVFDQMIRLNVRAFGHWSNAFDFSEQSRARTLLDAFSLQQDANKPRHAGGPQQIAGINPAMNRQVKALTITDVQTALPDDLRLLTYSVTDQGTYIFLVTRSGLDVAESSATTEILDRLTHDYVEGLKSKAPVEELSEKAQELYQYLIQPVEGRLGDGKTLCIVPDKALHFLPFAALLDRSGRYLIGSYRLMYAPSASALVRCIKESRAKGASKAERILAVGNPQFDHYEFPALENLPDAEREARESAAFYADRIVLNGAQATERVVRDELKNCNVAHLALHCLVEEKSPWLAVLVLAGQGAEARGRGPWTANESSVDDGVLYLNEIYGISLPRTSLVVLSACRSGLGQYYRGEGIVSLVRPFLALKVPTVLASLWSVDSQATANLMIEFHRQRKANNLGAGDALRAAQIKMADSNSYQHPYYWAPFIAVGSNN